MAMQSEILRGAYLTTGEAAALFAIHPLTVHKWIRAGRLESILVDHRRWVPKRALYDYYAALLANPATRLATVKRLEAVAEHAGVELDLAALRVDATALMGEVGEREATRA